MPTLLSWLRARLRRRRAEPSKGLTAVEYEAVALIAYEGRDAYARACEQAGYCLDRGSRSGCAFWSKVAIEVAARTGRRPDRRIPQRSP
jgi:hypothetical protein